MCDWAAHLLNAHTSHRYIYIYGSARYIPLLVNWVGAREKTWKPQKWKLAKKIHVLPMSLKGDPWCHNSSGDGEQCSPSLLLLGRQCSSGQPLWPGELEWEVWRCGTCSFFCHAPSFFIRSFTCLVYCKDIHSYHILNSVWKRIASLYVVYVVYITFQSIYDHLVVYGWRYVWWHALVHQVASADPKNPNRRRCGSLVGYGNPFGKPWQGPLVGETW